MMQRSFGPQLRAECSEIAAQAGSTLSNVIAHDKRALHSAARQRVARYLRDDRGMSLPHIGHLLGGRHHTTILDLLGRSPRKVTPAKLTSLRTLRLRVEALEAAVERLTAK